MTPIQYGYMFFSCCQLIHEDLVLYIVASTAGEQDEWLTALRKCELAMVLFLSGAASYSPAALERLASM